eukprot:693256-Prorocentrum_minimum.AAC.53
MRNDLVYQLHAHPVQQVPGHRRTHRLRLVPHQLLAHQSRVHLVALVKQHGADVHHPRDVLHRPGYVHLSTHVQHAAP